jgi:Circularly permutated YpsA SLOG family
MLLQLLVVWTLVRIDFPAKSHRMKSIPRIVSVVKPVPTALHWALERGVTCGGWRPKGRKAEDGVIEAKYPLKESSSSSYLQRTEWNVRDSDGTVVFSLAPKLAGGSLKTVEFARKHSKPLIHVCALNPDPAGRLQRFLEDNVIDHWTLPDRERAKRRG